VGGAAGVSKAVRFINNLTHTKGEWAGKTFNLRPWQRGFIDPLFGTMKANGRRRYRTCYVEIPRKNGKSEIAAAIALYMLIGDGEQGAEVYSAAVDREQASLVFGVAAQMVRNDEKLANRLEIIDSRRRIYDPVTNSVYVAIPADAAGRHGYNASAIIYDEIHAAPNRDLYDVLSTSTGARAQPLIFSITTAGWDRNSICWELHQYAEKVRDGIIDDPSFLPVLYSAPLEADWTSPEVWRSVNPALGDFRSLEEFEIAAKRAVDVPGQQNAFRRLYLCQWTEQASRWLPMDVWDECDHPVNVAKGDTCYAGLDLANTQDVAALVLWFPRSDGTADVLPFFWVPEDGIVNRSRSAGVPYDEWSRDGLIFATEGNVIDYDVIRDFIKHELASQYRIKEIAYDRWNAHQIVTQLQSDGANMVPIGQGFASMSAPSKEFETLLMARKIRHGGNRVLRWMASNVAIEQDAAGNIKPSKAKSTEKIDGVVASIMALGRAVLAQQRTASVDPSYTADGRRPEMASARSKQF
jgi:phage terminase large subunit-like protein